MTSRNRWIALGALLLAGCVPPTPASYIHDGGIVYAKNPFGIPTRVNLKLPATVAPGAASAGYRTLAVDPGVLALAELQGSVTQYLNATFLIDTILKEAADAKPVPDKPVAIKDPRLGDDPYMLLLSVYADHAVIAVGQGASAVGPGQLMAISYTSPTKGRAVVHLPFPDQVLGRYDLATTFDLDQGKVSADALSDTSQVATAGHAVKRWGHWEFTSVPSASPSFTLRSAVFANPSDSPSDAGVTAFSANFLTDNRGAFILAKQTPRTGNVLQFLRNDGTFAGSAGHEFYVGETDDSIATPSATPALKAILPLDSSLYRPFPTDPAQGDPFGDPSFNFPN
jgi:hypothetical protein